MPDFGVSTATIVLAYIQYSPTYVVLLTSKKCLAAMARGKRKQKKNNFRNEGTGQQTASARSSRRGKGATRQRNRETRSRFALAARVALRQSQSSVLADNSVPREALESPGEVLFIVTLCPAFRCRVTSVRHVYRLIPMKRSLGGNFPSAGGNLGANA